MHYCEESKIEIQQALQGVLIKVDQSIDQFV